MTSGAGLCRAAMDSRVREVVRMIDRNPCTSVRNLARIVNLSVSRLEHVFKQETGTTLLQFRDQRRLQRAAHLLSTTELPIKQIAWFSGYRHPSNFNRAFQRKFGRTPLGFRFNR